MLTPHCVHTGGKEEMSWVRVTVDLFSFYRSPLGLTFWGNGLSNRHVQSLNAYPILKSLVPKPRTVIWIEAVCINQTDLTERSEQVAMMADIYQGATKTLAWLGDDEGDAETVADIMLRLWRQMTCEIDSAGFDIVTANTLHDPEKGLSLPLDSEPGQGVPPSDSQAWDALATFYSHPWFTRVWVIQEVTLCQESVNRYAQRELPWYMVTIVANCLDHRNLVGRSK